MDFAKFHKDEKFSDITIKISGRTVPCHKLVLCSRSDYFNKLCGKNSHFAEREQSVVELKDDDPDAVEALIRHLYCNVYYDDHHERCNDWTFHAEVARSATKYMVAAIARDARAQSILLLNKLEAAPAIHDALVIIREQFADDYNLTVQAGSMQKKHMNALLQEPRFRGSLRPEEIDQQLVRLSAWVDGLVERQCWECEKCRRMSQQQSSCCGYYGTVKQVTVWVKKPAK